MDKLQENNSESGVTRASADNDVSHASVGQRLKLARERLGLTIEDVVLQIKLAPRQIVALESDDFNALPEIAYVRGFVRSYAKLLQIDPQPILDVLPGPVQIKIEPVLPDPSLILNRAHGLKNINYLLAAVSVVLLIVGVLVWKLYVQHPVATPIVVDDVASNVAYLPLPEQLPVLDASGVPEAGVPESAVVSAAPAVIAINATKTNLRLVFDKGSWTDIREHSGKPLSKQYNLPGSELKLEGVAPFTLVIGHAKSVRLYYRDKLVDLTPYIKAGSDVARVTLE